MAYIQDLGNGKYKVYVDVGYVRGRRVRRTKTITATSDRDLNRQAKEFEFEIMKQQEEGMSIDNITFERFVDRWIENHVKVNLKLTTLDTYRQIIDAYLLDYFGNMKMKDIKSFHIVEFLALEETMKADKHNVLRSIFKRAVEWDVITNDPTDKVKRPKRKRKEIEYYTEEELNHLFKILENEYPKHRIMVKLAAIGGLRRAEVAGIREESINYDENYIFIDKQLRYDKNKKTFYLAPVKNNKPRKVYFPESFMQELKQYHTSVKKQKLAMGNLWKPLKDDEGNDINLLLVKENGYPAHVDSITSEWRKIRRKYKLKDVTFHGLRHSCASLMVSKGINFKIIQERLGHSNISITLDTYSHIEPEKHKESTDVFSDLT